MKVDQVQRLQELERENDAVRDVLNRALEKPLEHEDYEAGVPGPLLGDRVDTRSMSSRR